MNFFKKTFMLFAAGALCGGCCCTQDAVPGKLDLSQIKHGIVCFTFDDGVYQTWLPERELFRKYNAHATFFYTGRLSDEALDSMRKLTSDGHTVGLHGVAHRDAPQVIAAEGTQRYFDLEVRPQLDDLKKGGITVRHYAYPNNRYDDASNALLKPYFRHFRAGMRPGAPKGFWIADQPQAFYDLDQIEKMPVLGGCGIGPYYLSTQENLDAALEKAAKENKLLVFYSHKILPEAKGVHISHAMLEASLKKASSLGMKIAGFDELP